MRQPIIREQPIAPSPIAPPITPSTVRIAAEREGIMSSYLQAQVARVLAELRKQHGPELTKGAPNHIRQLLEDNGVFRSTAEADSWDRYCQSMPHIPGEIDRISFLDESYKEQMTHFPLKADFDLICAATLALIQEHPENNKSYLETLKNTVLFLLSEQRCSKGQRTELLMTLNRVHPGIDIVEDLLGTVLKVAEHCMLEELEKISPSEQYQAVQKHLRADNNYLSDAKKNDLIKAIGIRLNKLGLDSDSREIAKKISDVVEAWQNIPPAKLPGVEVEVHRLEQLCGYAIHFPRLPKEYEKFTVELENNIKAIYKKTKEYSTFEAFKTAGVPQFIRALESIKEYAPLLTRLDNQMHQASVKALLDNLIPKLVDKNVLTLMLATNLDKLIVPIQTAEKEYRRTHPHHDFICNIFSLLQLTNNPAATKILVEKLNKILRSEYFTDDAQLTAFIAHADGKSGILEIGPYHINRLLLQAMRHTPQDWTPRFLVLLTYVLNFIKELRNKPGFLERELANSAYPDSLIQYIELLMSCYRITHETDAPKLQMLPEEGAHPFARDLVLPEPAWTLLENEPFNKLMTFINTFEMNQERGRLLTMLALKIQNGDQLVYVLQHLPELDRLEFAKECVGKIRDDSELVSVLQWLPKSARAGFRKEYYEYKEKMATHKSRQLGDAPKQVPEPARLGVVKEPVRPIQDGYELSRVLEQRPESDRLGFARVRAEKIQSGHQLADVLKQFSESTRLAFASKQAGKIRDIYELTSILKQLPEAAQLVFARKHGGAYPLISVLEQLSESVRLGFARARAGEIWDGYKLASILEQLPESDRLSFAREHAGKIQGGYELASILKQLPRVGRFDFAKEYAEKIRNDDQLSDVLGQLSEAERAGFRAEYRERRAANNLQSQPRLNP